MPDSIPGDVTTTATLSPGAALVDGTVETSYDRDWYRLSLTAGQTYYFFTAAHSNGGAMDTTFYLRNAAGTNLLYDDDGGPGLFSLLSYTPTTSGTYYLDVGGFSSHTGVFSVGFSVDDFGANVAGAGTLTVDGTATQGIVDYQYDSDWFAVALDAGQMYEFITQAPLNGTAVDTALYLREANGLQLAADNDFNSSFSRLIYAANTASTLYLDVRSSGSTMGGYGVVARALADTIAGDSSTAETLEIGVVRPGSYIENATDHDWYAVTLTAGERYYFYTRSYTTSAAVDTVLTLRASGGTLLLTNNNAIGQYSSVTFVAPSDGTYYLDVSGNNGSVGAYALSGNLDTVRGNVNTLAAVSFGYPGVDGTVDGPGDQDWFAVDLVAGESYFFRTERTYLRLGMDTLLNLRDAAGTVIATNDNYNSADLFSQIVFTATSSGRYYIDVAGGSQTSFGFYTLVALQDDAGQTAATAGAIGLGGAEAVDGAIDARGDHDWFGVRLQAGQTYYILTRAPAEGTAVDTNLAILAGNGNVLASNANFAGNFSQIAFTPTTTRTYYIDVSGAGSATGGYGLVVLPESDAIQANVGTTGTLAVGAPAIAGTIDRAGDHDWYAVTLVAGQSYAFTTLDPATGASVDTTLTLRDGAGASLALSANLGTNHAQVLYSVATSGVYYVDIGATQTLTGDYAVRAASVVDAIGSTAATAGAVTAGGPAVSSTLDAINDHDWFAVSLEEGHSYQIAFRVSRQWSLPDFAVLDSDGQPLGANFINIYAPQYNERLLYLEPATSGTYYLDASTRFGSGIGYSITVREEPVPALGSVATTTSIVADAAPVQGLIDWSYDRDWFAVTLEAGESYVLRTQAPSSGTFVNTGLDLRAADGSLLRSSANYYMLGEEIFFTPTTTGTYYLDVRGEYGSTGGYSLSAVRESIAGNVNTTASLSTDGTSTYTSIDGIGDRDWFSVSLVAGETYFFFTGPDAGFNGGATEMALRSADGSVLAQNDDFGGRASSRIVFTAATSGTYFVDVGGEGNYYATDYAVTAAHDAIGSDVATADTLAIGGSVQSSIDGPQDRDWLAVTLAAGESYYYYVEQPSGGPDTRLLLRDGSGAVLAGNDNREGNLPVVSFTATDAGTYYLEVSGSAATPFATGGYSVGAMVATTHDGLPSTAATAASVVVNGSARQGVIDYPTDHDWLRVTLVAGETYLFSTGAPASGSGVDTVLTLRSPSGTVIASNDNAIGTNSALVFTAATDGVYFLDIGSSAGVTGGYSVQAETMPVLNPTEIAARIAANNGTPHRFSVAAGDSLTVNLTGLTAEGQALARAALTLWSDASGLAFAETSGSAAITFDDAAAGVVTTWTEAGGIIASATVNVGLDVLAAGGTGPASASMQSYLAAIGQALGLGTPGAYAANPTYPGDAAFANDGWASSVLSAFDSDANTFFAGLGYTVQPTIAPTAADIIAIQQLYGPVTDQRTGDTVYGFGNTSGLAIHDAVQFRGAAVTIADGGGIDTLDLSGYADSYDQIVDLRPQHLSSTGGSSGNLWIARGTRIENALTGLGNDVIYGNNMANTLSGGAGDDRLYGAQEADTISGGAGNDIVAGGSENDALGGNAGNDIVIGGTGRDFCSGNSGADVFRFSESDFGGSTTASADVIFDFTKAEFDRIDLRRVDAVSGGTDQAFSFIATAAFSGVAGQLRYELLDGNTYVSGDTDGDGAANFMVRLNGEITLVAADFVL